MQIPSLLKRYISEIVLRKKHTVSSFEIKMLEFYVESMKDHRTCFKCKLTGMGREVEEITICYYGDVTQFGSMLRKRKINFKKSRGFDCKYPHDSF